MSSSFDAAARFGRVRFFFVRCTMQALYLCLGRGWSIFVVPSELLTAFDEQMQSDFFDDDPYLPGFEPKNRLN